LGVLHLLHVERRAQFTLPHLDDVMRECHQGDETHSVQSAQAQ
jgi:hypothetical protein